jgi:hypothetical protein
MPHQPVEHADGQLDQIARACLAGRTSASDPRAGRLDCSKGFRRNGASDHSVEYMSPYLSRERELVTIWGIGPPSCPDGRSGPASSSHLD